MKIIDIEVTRIALPFEIHGPRQGIRPGTAPWTKMESLLVKVRTDDGLEGWGEAFGHFANDATDAVLRTMLMPWFIGKDCAEHEALLTQAQRTFFSFGRNGPVLYALSGIDIALWDIAAKRAGLPLFRLLGGASGRVGQYASLMRYGGDEDAIERNCARARETGFSMLKLHEHTVEAYRAARRASGADMRICIDVNCRWSFAEAETIAREFHEAGAFWLEEPIWPPEDFNGMARLRGTGQAIAGGENTTTAFEFERAFTAGAFDFVQPSLCKVGGIAPMLRILDLAYEHGVEAMPHSFYWGPGFLASAHIAAARKQPTLLEVPYVTFQAAIYPQFNPELPTVTLPEVAGLGFAPDWDHLESGLAPRRSISR